MDIMRSVWVPLILSSRKTQGMYGYEGFTVETNVARTLIVSADKTDEALSLEWEEITSNSEHVPYVEEGQFHTAEEFIGWKSNVSGIHPVLEQSLPDEPTEWHLHYDIVLGLGLKKEGDHWVRPEEDYLKIAELRRAKGGKPEGIFIRMEHLRDFLCARNSGLLIASYSERAVVLANKPEFDWENGRAQLAGEHFRWKGFITPIAEGGHPFGSRTAVIWAGRKTPEPENEVPTHAGPGDEDIETSFREIKHEGNMLYDVRGELWRNEWVPPAERSPRVRRDREESTVEFIVDGSGRRAAGSQLDSLRGWLWFSPAIISELLLKRHGMLEWYTRDTGSIGHRPSSGVHFGVNSKNLINVYASDIYRLPDIYKRIWQAHNVPPDGPPSQELWMSQMQARPAKTIAPEMGFFSALVYLEKISKERLGSPLLKSHDSVPQLLRQIHRFRGTSIQGLCSLSKDLDQLITERIDNRLLEHFAPPPDKNFRSIKRLSYFLDTIEKDGRHITAPLAGVSALRQGDAHLPSSELNEAFKLIGLDNTGDYFNMAQRMIEMMCITLAIIADSIKSSSLAPK